MRRSHLVRALIALGLTVVGIGCAPSPAPPPTFVERFVVRPSGDSLWTGLLGSGPDTVLVVPGGPALGHAYLVEALAPLGRSHALLFYDGRGRGLSSPVPPAAPGVSPSTDAADLLAVMDAYALGSAPMIAHGYGAVIVGTALGLAPDRVRRTVLLAPEPGSPTAVYDLSSEPMDSSAARRYGEDFAAGLAERDAATFCRRHWGFGFAPVEDLRPSVVEALADSVCAGRADNHAAAAAIKSSLYTAIGSVFAHWEAFRTPAPVLVVQGDRDRIHAFWSRAYAGAAPDGRFVEVPDASGTFPWTDASTAVLEALSRFLDGTWPANAVRPAFDLRRPPLDSLGPGRRGAS